MGNENVPNPLHCHFRYMFILYTAIVGLYLFRLKSFRYAIIEAMDSINIRPTEQKLFSS